MLHRREKFTKKEFDACENFASRLIHRESKTKRPVIIAMIGLVGSGKSSVADVLADLIGATVISADDIRVELRKSGERYEKARAIAEDVMVALITNGENIILDSDFIDVKKRASLREKARRLGVDVHFVCVYADIDATMGRIITAGYRNIPDDFFGGAAVNWKGSDQTKGAIVKLREMLRRMPLHYSWAGKAGGQWVIKKPPCKVVADIDTTDPIQWKKEIAACAKKIIEL